MDSFTFTLNKIAGAVLGTCLVGMGIGIVAQEIYYPAPPKKPGYALPEPKEGAGGGGGKPAAPSLPALLAKADPKKGEADAKVCSACHNFAEGAGSKVGPDLYGVVDREKGSVQGFDYSAGMKKKGGKWTFADLNEFITKPQTYVQGTKMGYSGEESPEKRAEIIAYLRTLSKNPAPLPKVTESDKKVAEGGGKSAGGGGSADPFVKEVAASDPKKGEAAAKVCASCHHFKKGEGTLVGPELWGVVDRPKGSEKGFDYSEGLKKKGGKWTYDDLNKFLTKPQEYVQGTKMGYPGEGNEKKRAAIVAYLRTLADKPAPMPSGGEAEKKPEGGKPAAGGKAAEGGGGDKVAKLVAESDPKKGENAAKVCSACHHFKKGEGTLVGPELWGVVDREKGSEKGFDYSAGLKKKGGKWTYDDLDQFLTKPQAYVQGTKMGYPGEANEKKRAAIIAYLRTLSDKPAALPGAGGGGEKKPEEKKPEQAADKGKQPEAKKPEQGADQGKKPEENKKPEETKPAQGAEAAKPPEAKKPEEKKPEPAPEKKSEGAKPAEGQKAAESGGGDIVKLVAAADPNQGKADAQICAACHHFNKGGGNLVGPELWGVVDRDKGSEKGFDYSAGMKAKGGKWTYADLNQFLTKPQAYVNGTKMGFPGEADEKKRAAIIAFLRTQADKPAPLPGAADKK